MPELTRTAGLSHLNAVTPSLGRRYAERRNTDRGPDASATTSVLSPYLRRRLVLEQEAVQAALEAHGPAAEKFVQEVFWRSYFKGHLETRPWLWTGYRDQVTRDQARLAAASGLRQAYDQATTGATGVDGFDDWARDLVRHNWLHNHTRMWFASIWIFTLGLPWALGADFFMRHLLDGDPASNTLSWRWVAGLHTRGRAYAARAENIFRYTEGRYRPDGLNESPEALDEPEGPPPAKLPTGGTAPAGDVALLLHLDDLYPESLDLGPARPVLVCPMLAHAADAADPVRQADREAMADAVARATAHFGCSSGERPPGMPAVAAWAPAGPSADTLPPNAIRIRRGWDEAVWPAATRGYFKVREAIPRVLRAVL